MASMIVVVDMLNPYTHEDAEPLMASVADIVGPLGGMLAQAREQELEVVYVNDNYGDWSVGRPDLIEQALQGAAPELVEAVVPPPEVAFVVKARHSIFYQTPLEYLLRQAGVNRIALTGQVTEQCILYSALDAYVRHFEVVIARDAVAHIHEDLADAAVRMMAENMRAHVVETATEALERL
jgi:nicotinamidase-related amidase